MDPSCSELVAEGVRGQTEISFKKHATTSQIFLLWTNLKFSNIQNIGMKFELHTHLESSNNLTQAAEAFVFILDISEGTKKCFLTVFVAQAHHVLLCGYTLHTSTSQLSGKLNLSFHKKHWVSRLHKVTGGHLFGIKNKTKSSSLVDLRKRQMISGLTFLSLRMKRISMSQRKVAAAPVHTRIITSTFAFPSSPGKRRTVVNYQIFLERKNTEYNYINSGLCCFVIKRKQAVTTEQIESLVLHWRFHIILWFICLSINSLWEVVYKMEVETHSAVYFWFVWDMNIPLFSYRVFFPTLFLQPSMSTIWKLLSLESPKKFFQLLFHAIHNKTAEAEHAYSLLLG